MVCVDLHRVKSWMLNAISAWLSGCITEYWVHWLGFVSGFQLVDVLGITIVGVLGMYIVQCLTMSGAVAAWLYL